MADRERHRPASSKYDPVKVKVWLTSDHSSSAHYFILSRFLVCRMLTVTRIPQMKAVKIAMELKKQLVDNDQLEITQANLEQNLFRIMESYGFGSDYVVRYKMVNQFLQQKRPLVILICGAPCSGKSTVAQLLASQFNLPNVVQTDIVHELLSHSSAEGSKSQPVWERELSNDELIDSFKREAAKVRRAVTGDLMKAAKDGKSIIMEGAHLDPGLFLYEFGKYGTGHLLQEGARILSQPLKSAYPTFRRSSLDMEIANRALASSLKSAAGDQASDLPQAGEDVGTSSPERLQDPSDAAKPRSLHHGASFAFSQSDGTIHPHLLYSDPLQESPAVLIQSRMQSYGNRDPSLLPQQQSPASEWLAALSLPVQSSPKPLPEAIHSTVPASGSDEIGNGGQPSMGKGLWQHPVPCLPDTEPSPASLAANLTPNNEPSRTQQHHPSSERRSRRGLLMAMLSRFRTHPPQTETPAPRDPSKPSTRKLNSPADSPALKLIDSNGSKRTRPEAAENVPAHGQGAENCPTGLSDLENLPPIAPKRGKETSAANAHREKDAKASRLAQAQSTPAPPSGSKPLSFQRSFSRRRVKKRVSLRAEDELSDQSNKVERFRVDLRANQVPASVFSIEKDSSSGEEAVSRVPEYLRQDSDFTQAESLAFGLSEQYSSEGEKDLHESMREKLRISQVVMPAIAELSPKWAALQRSPGGLPPAAQKLIAETESAARSIKTSEAPVPTQVQSEVPPQSAKTSHESFMGFSNTPVFVIVVLRMAKHDRDMLVHQKLTRFKAERRSKAEIAGCLERLELLEDYLASYSACNVPVLSTSLPELATTADLLHDYLLECISLQMQAQP